MRIFFREPLSIVISHLYAVLHVTDIVAEPGSFEHRCQEMQKKRGGVKLGAHKKNEIQIGGRVEKVPIEAPPAAPTPTPAPTQAGTRQPSWLLIVSAALLES